MMNDLPTIYEVVSGKSKKQSKERLSVSNRRSNKSKSGSKGVNFKLFHKSLWLSLINLDGGILCNTDVCISF